MASAQADDPHSQSAIPASVTPESPTALVRPHPIQTPADRLVLTGTIVGTPQRALIQVNGRGDEPFVVGQTITPGVRLVSVDRNSAIINHHGVIETLKLHHVFNATQISDTRPNDITPPNSSEPNNAPNHATQNFFLSQVQFANHLFDVTNFSTSASFTRVPNGGVQFTNIVGGSIFDELGLNNGDIVFSINDNSILSEKDLADAFLKRKNTDQLDVEIMRAGVLYNAHFDTAYGILFSQAPPKK